MRVGVLDIGSNTGHLLVVDAHEGGHPDPVRSHKTQLRLAELLRSDGSLGPEGTKVLVHAAQEARAAAEDEGVEDLMAFATSAVREATDSAAVLQAVRDDAGVDLRVLPGEDEARLTFLAVRRWFGWSAGRLLCLDIGGGSLELAAGIDEEPEVALSVPLGAGRLTRDRLPGDPPRKKDGPPIRVRVIEYSMVTTDQHGEQTSELFALATTLLDEQAHPAIDLAALYHARWQAETGIGDLKTAIRGGPEVVLRSKTPTGVEQEFWAMLCVYQAIRELISYAAPAGLDPGRVSFKRAFEAARDSTTRAALSPLPH